MINFRFIANLMGKLLIVESAFLLPCILVAMLYGEPDVMAFLYTTLITAGAGFMMTWFIKPKYRILSKKDGYFTVTMVWIIFSLFGCLPYILGQTIHSFADAFFETMSGFTTTGSTILDNIESVPHATLFWRSLTQWLGGLGIVMLFIAILPNLGIEGRDLYVAESTGPTHSKTSFTFTSSARQMWTIYTSLTLLQALLLVFGGMNFFDGICHSFTTMSTGGFSTKQASLAYWDSPYIQYVTIVFMLMGGTNFGLLITAIRGNWRKLVQDNEFQLYILIAFFASVIIGLGLYFHQWAGLEKSMRDATFQVVTIMTTTGFSTVDYLLWPPLVCLILFLLFFTGSSAGSTAGGMKIIRVYMLFKNSLLEFKRIIHPNGIINVKYNGKSVHPNIMTGIMGLSILYVIIFVIGSIVMTLCTEDIITATSTVITAMSNVGPAFCSHGIIESFSYLNGFAKLFLSFLMLVGRLEILTVMVLFTRSFWER